jgi:mRNA interferase MazF
MRRGEVYLVNFGKKYNSEFGKIRPALIIQNDIANRVIDRVAFKGVTLLPLTTRLSGGGLRVRIEARDRLEHTSEICINEICTLDLTRIDLERHLTTLTEEELAEVSGKLAQHLALL